MKRIYSGRSIQDPITTDALKCIQAKSSSQNEEYLGVDAAYHGQCLRLVGQEFFPCGWCGQLQKSIGSTPLHKAISPNLTERISIDRNSLMSWSVPAVATDDIKSTLVFIEGVKVISEFTTKCWRQRCVALVGSHNRKTLCLPQSEAEFVQMTFSWIF